MTDKITDGICRAVHNEFGEEYHIYTEKAEQRFTRPCFFVELKKSSLELFRGERYYMQTEYIITYYPLYKEKNENMQQIWERLFLCLNTIEADGAPLRCSACNHSLDGEKLRTEVSYSLFVRLKQQQEDSELMEEYNLNFK